MTKINDIEVVQSGNRISMEGDLVTGNLEEALSQVEMCLSSELSYNVSSNVSSASKPTEISLKGLKQSNSICLSFILCCMRYAKSNKQKVYFTNISKELNNLITAYNLAGVINKSTKTSKTSTK